MPFCLYHSLGSMPAGLEKWKELSSHWVFMRVMEIYTSFSKPLQTSHSPDLPFILFFDRLLFAPTGSAVSVSWSVNWIWLFSSMPRGQHFWAPSSHVSEMHRVLWMQLFREAVSQVSQVKQWPRPRPFWGAPKPVCWSGGSKAGGLHSYCCGVGRVVSRMAQVKMSQTLVLLLRCSSFSWVNSLQMAISLWLISSVLNKLI